jgi:hypothetical protein
LVLMTYQSPGHGDGGMARGYLQQPDRTFLTVTHDRYFGQGFNQIIELIAAS